MNAFAYFSAVACLWCLEPVTTPLTVKHPNRGCLHFAARKKIVLVSDLQNRKAAHFMHKIQTAGLQILSVRLSNVWLTFRFCTVSIQLNLGVSKTKGLGNVHFFCRNKKLKLFQYQFIEKRAKISLEKGNYCFYKDCKSTAKKNNTTNKKLLSVLIKEEKTRFS